MEVKELPARKLTTIAWRINNDPEAPKGTFEKLRIERERKEKIQRVQRRRRGREKEKCAFSLENLQ